MIRKTIRSSSNKNFGSCRRKVIFVWMRDADGRRASNLKWVNRCFGNDDYDVRKLLLGTADSQIKAGFFIKTSEIIYYLHLINYVF